MKIVLSGYSGLIGSAAERVLKANGYEVFRLTRSDLYEHEGTAAKRLLEGAHAVVHLAGAPILKRWTEKNRKAMYDSRIITTRNLVNAIKSLPAPARPKIFISASAIGIYEAGLTHTESSTCYAGHFAAQLTREWEASSEGLPKGVRRLIFRVGLVIDRNATLVRMLKLPFRLYAGGPVGNGRQPFPFIHLDDVTGAILWGIRNHEAQGIYNLTAPEQISNKDFSAAFGKSLNRPSWFPVPVWILKILYGKASRLIFESPAVLPERLQNEGYRFRYPDIRSALGALFG
jgi:hypothetical protein